MNLRDHERAILAMDQVTRVQEGRTPGLEGLSDKDKQGFGAICHKLPVLVHTAGLTAALHFVAGRNKDGQRLILTHLAEQLEAAGLIGEPSAEALLKACREADLGQLQALTREVQRCLLWSRRFVKSVMKLDASDGEA